ncbi:hypothetical protein ABVG11_36595 [Streptomyces sp. HD1123-B1]|uniref:hypothetical protein n=1 Tax=Streptomyces huangiella TaxID=3228804 RepID=UPI003D7D1AB0
MLSHDFPAVFFEATRRPEASHNFVLSSYALPPRGPARTATLTTLAAALAPGAVLTPGRMGREGLRLGEARGTWPPLMS